MKNKELIKELKRHPEDAEVGFEVSGTTPDGKKDYFPMWFENTSRSEDNEITIRFEGED